MANGEGEKFSAEWFIVLGSTHKPNGKLSDIAERRVLCGAFAFIDAYQGFSSPFPLIITAGLGYVRTQDQNILAREMPHALLLADRLMELGVPYHRIRTLAEPENTVSEIIAVRDLFSSTPESYQPRSISFVTSPSHVRRVTGCAKSILAGLDVGVGVTSYNLPLDFDPCSKDQLDAYEREAARINGYLEAGYLYDSKDRDRKFYIVEGAFDLIPTPKLSIPEPRVAYEGILSPNFSP